MRRDGSHDRQVGCPPPSKFQFSEYKTKFLSRVLRLKSQSWPIIMISLAASPLLRQNVHRAANLNSMRSAGRRGGCVAFFFSLPLLRWFREIIMASAVNRIHRACSVAQRECVVSYFLFWRWTTRRRTTTSSEGRRRAGAEIDGISFPIRHFRAPTSRLPEKWSSRHSAQKTLTLPWLTWHYRPVCV